MKNRIIPGATEKATFEQFQQLFAKGKQDDETIRKLVERVEILENRLRILQDKDADHSDKIGVIIELEIEEFQEKMKEKLQSTDENDPKEKYKIEIEINRGMRSCLKRLIKDLRKRIDILQEQLSKSKKAAPKWEDDLYYRLEILLHDIRGFSMDLKDSRKLVKERKWGKYEHVYVVKEGDDKGKIITEDVSYVLYEPDYIRLERKMGIRYSAIVKYLKRLCEVLPNFKKLGRKGERGQAIYAVGYYSNYGRQWFFTGNEKEILSNFKLAGG